MTHNEAVKMGKRISNIYSEPAIVINAYGIEDIDCFGALLREDSPYTVCLDSEVQEQFGDMSHSQMEARIKAIVE